MALASCRRCAQTCKQYWTTPAQVYLTLPKMYEALEAAGLIERDAEKPKDLCDGCAEEVNGGCRRGYQAATLSLDGSRVVKCSVQRERRKSV